MMRLLTDGRPVASCPGLLLPSTLSIFYLSIPVPCTKVELLRLEVPETWASAEKVSILFCLYLDATKHSA